MFLISLNLVNNYDFSDSGFLPLSFLLNFFQKSIDISVKIRYNKIKWHIVYIGFIRRRFLFPAGYLISAAFGTIFQKTGKEWLE